MPGEQETDQTPQKIRRRCSNCGEEWTETANSHVGGYDCFTCGASASNFETVCCSKCGDPIREEWIRTEGKAHPECAEEKYAE